MERKVDVITDVDGSKIVFIHDVIFKGRRSINWNDVEDYLKEHVGEVYSVTETSDLIFIGDDLPDEYAHSNYTVKIHGTTAKAKANAVQGMKEIIETATDKKYTENKKVKHKIDARYGWYKYESKFALPIFDENEEIDHYNI